MLRISMPGAQGAPPAEDPQAAMPPQEEAADQPAMAPEGGDSDTAMDDDEMGLPKIEPGPAGYMGPESGPFKCGNCIYFEQNGSCHIVAGPIDAEGCCNIYTPKATNTAAEPQEEAAPETEPTNEPEE